ncbi:YncE family protein [Oxalobacteraceae bacterium CAVE-383]|nr:YncE family protein [Oxalobacteraceae bacterium CAVE-383]
MAGNKIGVLLLAAIALSGTVPALAAPAGKDMQFARTKKYALGGIDRWDYLGIDPVRHHLFISRASHVQVLDTDTGKQVADIPDTDGVHGFAFAQDRKLGFITNGHADTVTAFDLDTFKAVATIQAGGRDPDAILYAPGLMRAFVSNGESNSVSVIDAANARVIATMDVGGKPESLAADNAGMVFVAIEDKNEIVAMNGKTGTVAAHWPLAGCDEPSGLALDAASRRLFAVCSNKRMAVVDADSGRMITTLPIGGKPDAAAFDPVFNTVFSANGGDGTLTVVHEDDPEHFRVTQNVSTQAGARTLAFDADTHSIYLASAKLGKRPAPTSQAPHPHPPVQAGSFVILLVQPEL